MQLLVSVNKLEFLYHMALGLKKLLFNSYLKNWFLSIT